MDNDYHLNSVPLLSVDEQILMPIATMGSSSLHHLHHHEQQSELQQTQPAELDAGLNVHNSNVNNNNNHSASHDSNDTTILTTTHLDSVVGAGVVETASNSYGNYFNENHTINNVPPAIVHATMSVPPTETPIAIEPKVIEPEAKNSEILLENKENQLNDLTVTEEKSKTTEDGEEAVAEQEEEEGNDDPEEDIEEEVEELDEEEEEEVEEFEPIVIAEEEEIIPDVGNNEEEPPEEIIPDTEINNEDVLKVESGAEDKNPKAKTTNHDNDDLKSESEQPMSSIRATKRKEEEVDENQCRVCCTKEDLVSIFKKIEGQTGAEMLMALCPAVSIAVKDFLPQFVCHTCMGKIMLAIKLKQQVETTEKELRKKLSRHKNKVRRPAGYVVISAPLDSDSDTDDEANNDEEFKVSDVASATPSEDSDSSESSDNKKKTRRGRKRRKSAVTPTLKSKSKSGKSENGSSDNDDNGDPIGNHKRKRSSNSSPETFACDVCEQIFTRKQSLILHRKVHDTDREPIACRVCGKKFKVKGAYRTHMERHREEAQPYKCQKCSRKFATSSNLKDHMEEEHRQSQMTYECQKCKRKFVSAGRYKKHKQGHCPGVEMAKSKRNEVETFVVGKDLFKSVAPLTTTYWSDSFSD